MNRTNERSRVFYKFIEGYIDEKGIPPTLREISAGTDGSSTSVVNAHLNVMDKEGWLRHIPEVARGIVLIGMPGEEVDR